MKKTSFLFGILAILAFAASCETKIDIQNNPIEPQSEQITITASIPDGGLTKVSLTPDVDGSSKPILKLAWEDDDVITVNGETFTIVPASKSVDGKTASFTGSDPGAGPYTIVYSDLPGDLSNQIQSVDNNAGHLGYAATLTGVDAFTDVQFSSAWASSHSGTFSQAGALLIQAKLPTAEIADAVQKVIIRTTENSLNGANTLSVNIGTPGVEGDGQVINVYATLSETATLAADSELIIDFQVSANAYDKYTAYRKLAASKNLEMGKLNEFKLNCEHINQYAGTSDAGTSVNPFLIGDQHQMNAMHDLMSRGETKYFKLVDKVDMTGIVWFPLNNGYPEPGGTKLTGNIYDKAIDFNGNSKVISNIATNSSSPTTSEEYASVFGVLMGNVYDLTIDKASITPKGKSGVLAGYVGTSTYGPNHCEISNVTITNSTVTGGDNYCGALAGQSAKNSNVFTNVTIDNCTVSSTGYASGFVTYFGNSATVSDISVSKTNVTSSGHANSADVPSDGFAGGIAARVAAAVDFDRCSYYYGTITGPTQENNDNSKKSRFVGGLVAYVSDVAATFDDCHVVDATMNLPSAPATNNGRYIGGAFGYLGAAAKVGNTKGCTVTGLSMNEHVRNYIAGFVSFLDGGTIKNSSASSESAIGNANYSGAAGGFIGYANGGTLYNNTTSVSVQGAGNPGGFIGWVETTAASFEKCSAAGKVTAKANNAGGFCGIDKIGSTYIECSSSGTVSSTAGYVGGLIGYINADGATVSKCYSTSTVSASNNYVGGLIGVSESDTIEKSYYDGTVSGNSRVGGILGISLKDDAVTISNCYSRGKIIGSNTEQRYGGIVGDLGKGGTITNCWSDSKITGGRVLGGIVGLACYQTWADNTAGNNTITGCIAWNPEVKAAQLGNYGSSGAVIGHTSFKNTFGNCYRRSDMDYANSYDCSGDEWDVTCVDQPDCDGTNWAKGTTPGTNAGYTYQQAYYGVAKNVSTNTVSSIARDIIGWSSSIWDFTGDLPTLK